MLRAVRLVSFIGLAAFIASAACSLGKSNGASCTADEQCASDCCMAGAICGEGCSEPSSSGGSHTSGSSSSGSSSSGSSSGVSSSSSSSGASDSGASAPAYVEFFEDFSKYGVAPGTVVQYIEAEGREFTPEPLAKGTGTCADKNVFQGEAITNPYDIAVRYTIYYRLYGTVEHPDGYDTRESGGAFRMTELKPGCNTFVIVDTPQGLGLRRQ